MGRKPFGFDGVARACRTRINSRTLAWLLNRRKEASNSSICRHGASKVDAISLRVEYRRKSLRDAEISLTVAQAHQ
jgi:hypothetical protein